MGGQAAGRVVTRRHLLHDHVRQLEIQAAGRDGCHLRKGRIRQDDDRPIGGLAAVAVHRLADAGLVHAGHFGEEPDRSIQVARVPGTCATTERNPLRPVTSAHD